MDHIWLEYVFRGRKCGPRCGSDGQWLDHRRCCAHEKANGALSGRASFLESVKL